MIGGMLGVVTDVGHMMAQVHTSVDPRVPGRHKDASSVCLEQNIFQEVFLTVICSDITLLKRHISI